MFEQDEMKSTQSQAINNDGETTCDSTKPAEPARETNQPTCENGVCTITWKPKRPNAA
jgi:hypothetical protein